MARSVVNSFRTLPPPGKAYVRFKVKTTSGAVIEIEGAVAEPLAMHVNMCLSAGKVQVPPAIAEYLDELQPGWQNNHPDPVEAVVRAIQLLWSKR